VTQEDFLSLAEEFRVVLARLPEHPEDLAGNRGKKVRAELEEIAEELRTRLTQLDPTRQPQSFFDPADPRLFGVFAALALVGQDRLPLASMAESKFYGSGIYAIYYNGDFKTYKPIAKTEHPIYVGKADPAIPNARTPRDQGDRLCGRLNEHRKNIERAESLRIADFECRYLVVATGWQAAAESALIGLFRPLWNKETGILLGFGKHGDSADTRRNTRSPWDVLHAGRAWAAADTIEDRKSPREIEAEVKAHLSEHAPVPDIEHIVRELTAQIRSTRGA
jgi:hypothetical protein